MRVFGFFLAAAGITTALVFGWTPVKKAEERCPHGYSLEIADPLSGQDHNANGFTCKETAPSESPGVHRLGIVGIDDK